MNTLIQEIISWIQDSDKKLIIGISGHGAAGKTTFAHRLIEELNMNVNYLNTDPYIVGSSIRKHAEIDYTYEGNFHRYKMTACHPEAHHIPALERDVRMIKEGMDLRTIGTHYSESKILTSQNKVSIVEGMCVAFANPELFDLLIYFYTNGETEFERRSSRDIAERGMELEYLKQSHNERRIQYELFMHPYSRDFDIVIRSSNETINIEKSTFNFKRVN